jgi:uncharacterized protein (TIGR02118 family)
VIKVYALIPKRPDLSDAEFHDHWRNPHGELAKRITTLVGYVQSHAIADGVDGLPPSIYRGIAEVWFDDLETALAMADDPNYTDHAGADEPNFIDMPRLSFLLCTERVVVTGPDVGVDEPETTALLLLRAREDVPRASLAECLAALPLGAADGLRRYSVCVAVPEAYAEGRPAFDAVLELAWPDAPAFDAGWRSARARLDDLAEVADLGASASFLAEPYRVIWPLRSR